MMLILNLKSQIGEALFEIMAVTLPGAQMCTPLEPLPEAAARLWTPGKEASRPKVSDFTYGSHRLSPYSPRNTLPRTP